MCEGSSVGSRHPIARAGGPLGWSRLLSQRGWEAEHVTVGALGPFWKRLPPPTPPWRWAELQHRDLISLQGMKMFFMVVAAVYILYLLFLIVRACSELRHMPYVGQCHFTNAQCSPGQEAASHGGGGGGAAGGHQASGLTCRGRPRGSSYSHGLGTSTVGPWGNRAGEITLGHLNSASGQRRREARGLGANWARLQRGCGSHLDPSSLAPGIGAGGRLALSLSQAKPPHFTGSFPPVWEPPGLWRGGTAFPLGFRLRPGGRSLSSSKMSVAFTSEVVSRALLSFPDLRFEFLTALTFVVLVIR